MPLKFPAVLVFLACWISCKPVSEEVARGAGRPEWALVIHGGAGTIERDRMTPERDSLYRQALHEALDAGEAVLHAGGPSEDAVMAVVVYMENSPLFNAGRGAVFTADGRNELDAAIMRGDDLAAGAVTGMTRIKNPVLAAYAVMTASEHVFLSGAGADAFAESQGLDTVGPAYFFTPERWEALEKARRKEAGTSSLPGLGGETKYGTVGAVALDRAGNLAAATSTGGMTLKRWNRIGDAPVIGAGTYADNRACAVSCTGHGEYFIRYAVAHDLAARVRHGRASLRAAADSLIMGELLRAGGLGGLIALDTAGQMAMPFNTPGMYRGYARPGTREVAIYGDE